MPTGIVPPYEGPCKRTADGALHDDDVAKLGRYRGLCGVCRPIVAAEQAVARAARADPAAESDQPTERASADPVNRQTAARLTDAVTRLVPIAKKLETAVEQRRLSTLQARATLAEFKAGMALVGAAAQSLLNRSVAGSDQ